MLSIASFRSLVVFCPAGSTTPFSSVLAPVSWLPALATIGSM